MSATCTIKLSKMEQNAEGIAIGSMMTCDILIFIKYEGDTKGSANCSFSKFLKADK